MSFQKLGSEIDAQRPHFDSLVEMCPNLMALVSPQDAEDLETHLADVTNRYDQLGSTTQQIGSLLGEISQFDNECSVFKIWMAGTDSKISDVMSNSGDPIQLQKCREQARVSFLCFFVMFYVLLQMYVQLSKKFDFTVFQKNSSDFFYNLIYDN